MRRYFEDYEVGSSAEFGAIEVSAEEIVGFAERYDPQPFHLAGASESSPYGGLIASGWHTASMAMRVMVDHVVDGETSLGSPGLGPIRWLRPVRPGDVLRVRVRVLGARPSASKPDRGTITYEVDALNQHDEVVMHIDDWIAIVRRRPADPRTVTS
jgi:acyl dehydratase